MHIFISGNILQSFLGVDDDEEEEDEGLEDAFSRGRPSASPAPADLDWALPNQDLGGWGGGAP